MNYTSKLGTLVMEVPSSTVETPPSRYPVTPDGEHMTQERIRGLAWRDAMELPRAGFQSRRKAEKAAKKGSLVKVVVVELADWQRTHLGCAAG